LPRHGDAEERWIGENIENGSGVVTHETRFVYNGNEIVLQFDESGSGQMTNANLSHRYLWGPAVDQLLSDEQIAPQTSGQGYNCPRLAPSFGRLRTTWAQSVTWQTAT
jgi:hypothetical protein